MRLTLRTMLAYLDDVLEPADAEVLGKKIEESKFASDLVHRVRNSMRRMRLGAPKLSGKGMGLDANTVAEYLDSALAHDRVPDFEKVCLESDVHLAEVAACHQVLALVLGEPAHVEPTLRDRIYRLGQEGDAEQASTASSAAAMTAGDSKKTYVDGPHDGKASQEGSQKQPAEQEEPVSPAKKKEVPDYLRAGSRRRLWPLAATAALAFLIAAIVLWAMGENNPLISLFQGKQQEQTPSDLPPTNGDQRPSGTDDSGDGGVPAPVAGPNGGKSGEPTDVDNAVVPTPPLPDKIPGVDPIELPKPGDPNSATDPKTPALPVPGKTVPPEPGVPGKAPSDTLPKASVPSDTVPPPPGSDDKRPATPPVVPPITPDTPKPDNAASPEPVYAGRFVSNLQLLARYDAKAKEWHRLPANAPLVEGDRLQSFPTYRSLLAISAGIQLTLDDAAQVTLHASDQEKATAQLSIDYGRALIVTNGMGGSRVELDLAGRRGIANFVNADSALALVVRHYHNPGTDPEQIASQRVVQLFVTGGQINWSEAETTETLSAGQVLTLLNNQPGRIISSMPAPEWITKKGIENIDHRASKELETKLDAEQSLALSLLERVDAERERHVEVRSLAIRCLSYLDNHEPLVEALSDETYKSFWHAQIDAALDALARSSQSAAELRIAFEKMRDDNAPALYRILWGYSPDGLQEDGAVQLVEYLSSPDMDFRVLALDSLRRITGMSLLYRPEVSAARRRISTQRWKDRLKTGKIVYAELPSPLPESPAKDKPADDKSP